MNSYEIKEVEHLLAGNAYAGRGIVIGKSPDGKNACTAYFIMGRSANSRNRIFAEEAGSVYTRPFDASKVEDPSLIIYAALRSRENKLIITNGDHTDTIWEGLGKGKSFEESLRSRRFEPDAPNFTPRISGMVTFGEGDFSYEMSILKSMDGVGSACAGYHFAYEPLPGLGHLIHTYMGDGSPLPAFCGEPKRIAIPDSMEEFTSRLWNALDGENKISLYVRYTCLSTGKTDSRMINKNL